MAVVELKMPVERYETKVVGYLGKNAKSFEEIRIAVAGLEALGKKPAEAEGWLDQIAKMRGEDGTWWTHISPGTADAVARALRSLVCTLPTPGWREHSRLN